MRLFIGWCITPPIVPINPAPELQQTVSFPTPQLIDRHLLDRWSTNEADYQVVEPGSPHPNTREFAGYFLLKELPVDPQNPNWVFRVWTNGFQAQDTYNFETKYAEGSNAYPSYTRTYLVLRSQLGVAFPLTKLQPLTGIFCARVTAGGSNYEQSSVVATVAGDGTGAELLPIVTDGAVTHLIVRNPGTGYTTATVAFSGGGFGATAVVSLQPTNCLLTVEEQVRADDTNDWLYVKVRRQYETLPGPLIETYHFDIETGTEQTQYRQRVVAGTAADPTAALKIASVANGSPPTVTTDLDHGFTTGQTVLILGVAGSITNINGYRQITVGAPNTFTLDAVVSTGAATADTGYVSMTRENALNVTQTVIDSVVKPDEGAGTVTATLLTTTALLPGRHMSAPEYDTERAAYVDLHRQFVPYGYVGYAEGSTLDAKIVEDNQMRQVSAAMILMVTKTILLPGDAVTTLAYDEETGAVRQTIKTRVAIGSSPDTVGGWVLHTDVGPFVTQSKIVEENSIVGVKITEKCYRPTGTRYEVADGAEPMPAIFTYITGWLLGDTGYILHGPFLGVNYLLTLHGVSSPAFVEITYTWGQDSSDPVISGIFAPISGRSGIGLPVNGQTLHSDPGTLDGHYQFNEVPLSGPQAGIPQTVEIMPESIPAPDEYVTGDFYLRSYTDRPHEGGPLGIWQRRKYFFRST